MNTFVLVLLTIRYRPTKKHIKFSKSESDFNIRALDSSSYDTKKDSNLLQTSIFNFSKKDKGLSSLNNVKSNVISRKDSLTPKKLNLAFKLRPKSLEEFFGQENLTKQGSLWRTLVESDLIPSMILYGPPGTGKTTLANIIANRTNSNFVSLSAVTSGLQKLREIIENAKTHKKLNKSTILFVDEIHRWNKLQQDFLLPYVECGEITLIGATTENPSFECNAALLSRCKVFILERLSNENILAILNRAIKYLESPDIQDPFLTQKNKTETIESSRISPSLQETETKWNIRIEPEALNAISECSDGDARNALNALEIAWIKAQNTFEKCLSLSLVEKSFERTHYLYDKKGEEHYNLISALHKSIRGSDENASIYWLSRMLEAGEDPKYIARRMVRMASEDIGLEDNQALMLSVAGFHAVEIVGMPECTVSLTQIAVYLARAPKSNAMNVAYERCKNTIKKTSNLPVPLHIRNAPTKLMKELGYGKDYKYNHDYDEPVEQDYLPKELLEITFVPPPKNSEQEDTYLKMFEHRK